MESENQVPKLDIRGSRQLTSWLNEQNVSLGFTTYQAGKLFFVGRQKDGRMAINERTFSRCMGLCVDGGSLYMSSLYQIWRFENVLLEGQSHNDNDRLYVPQMSWFTGDLDVHDIGMDSEAGLTFVNTLFSCTARTSEKYSFEHHWHPEFIDRLVPEDRCHLNGLAMRDGSARYVSSISRSNVAEGWRDRREAGGIVIDIVENEILCEGLSMPHSPRWYKDRLWILESGTGKFGYIDSNTGRFESICFCPGYARGLSFVNDFAVIGLSKSRNKTFSGLALQDELARNDAEARCGIIVVDLNSGSLVHSLTIDGVVDELFDVVALPGVINPHVIGTISDEIRRVLSLPPSLMWYQDFDMFAGAKLDNWPWIPFVSTTLSFAQVLHPPPPDWPPTSHIEEVTLHASCLAANNGRIDVDIVNSSSAMSLYRLEFQGLTARQRSVAIVLENSIEMRWVVNHLPAAFH